MQVTSIDKIISSASAWNNDGDEGGIYNMADRGFECRAVNGNSSVALTEALTETLWINSDAADRSSDGVTKDKSHPGVIDPEDMKGASHGS